MKLRQILIFLLVVFAFSSGLRAQERYAVGKKVVEGRTTYHLLDSQRNMDVGIVPDVGNLAYEFKVNGKDVFIPPESFQNYLEKRWFCCGNPFLAPWANRIDRDSYFFQGKKYLLNDELGNLLRDQFKQAIHGLLVFDSRWEILSLRASVSEGAALKTRLNFYAYPDLTAQFPFAHYYVVTNRLKGGRLETTTEVHNVGKSPMPVLIAYHPYFRVDGDRAEWALSIGAQKHWKLSPQLIPTGETEPTEKFLPGAKNLALGQTFLDDLFSDFERGPDGYGHVWVKGKTQKVELVYGKEFDFAVIYAPLDNNLICIEPQTGPTNAFNLNHEGKFPGLTVLEPGGVFKASFWIIPTGY